MQRNSRKCENFYPDRTYANNAKRGTIVLNSKASTKPKRHNASEIGYVAKTKQNNKGLSFVKDLLSTRWTSKGAEIVVTKQQNTSEEAYVLAKRLQVELTNELIKNHRFVNDYDDFLNWFVEKEQILKDNGFHKKKG